MAYEVSKVDVWAADVPNRPGTLARVLDSLSDAGGQLEFMIARKVDDSTSRIFLAPIKGAKLKKAAQAAGLAPADGLASVRIFGPDKPGLGAKITRAVAENGVNLRGASAAGLGKQAVFYLAVEGDDELKKARQAVRKALAK
jgi:hypothetical protein